tara:strand:+ start:668 stop:2104 length:1437 start_codon:yes stop_codon:yes gene_type:complete
MMEEQNYFMGQDGFVWFVGVVEDRNDPDQIGRVRVRCLGFHSEDITEVPTIDLPWAHVMHPVTDASMHGLGNSPSFLVEGTWVIGFFRDAVEKQQPVIIGSLPGTPQSAADPQVGFNDPRSPESPQTEYLGLPLYGAYPVDGEFYTTKSGHEVGEPDTSRLGRGRASEDHESLKSRRRNRLRGDPEIVDPTVGVDDNSEEVDQKGTGVPTATQPFLSAVSDQAVQEERGFWEEPHPKSIQKDENPYISAAYPFNHVFESEAGHIKEMDDSPGAERTFTQHSAGTFEEIHPDGSKVVKIVGDNYEIVVGKSQILIQGDVNITTLGTVRELIKGDYHLEVEGNYTQKIHKNHRVKVGAGTGGGNREEEINGNHSFQVMQNVKGRVKEDVDIVIDKNETRLVNGTSTLNVVKDYAITSLDSVDILASDHLTGTTISGIMSFKSGDKLNMKSAALMHIKSETTIDMDATTEVDVDSALINLN